MAVIPRNTQYEENATHFQILIVSVSFVKEIGTKKAFRDRSTRRVPEAALGCAVATTSRGILQIPLRQLLEIRCRLKRFTYTPQNEAIAPQTACGLLT